MMTSSQPRNIMQIVLPHAFRCQVEFPICHSSKPCFYSKAWDEKRRYNWKVWNGSIVRHCCYILASVRLSLTRNKIPIFITPGSYAKETCLFLNSWGEKKKKSGDIIGDGTLKHLFLGWIFFFNGKLIPVQRILYRIAARDTYAVHPPWSSSIKKLPRGHLHARLSHRLSC